MCDLSLWFYLQLAYDIDKEAEEQNSYLDGMVCFPDHVLTGCVLNSVAEKKLRTNESKTRYTYFCIYYLQHILYRVTLSHCTVFTDFDCSGLGLTLLVKKSAKSQK